MRARRTGVLVVGVIAAGILAVAASPAQAAPIVLSFNATYTTSGTMVFGLAGSAAPFAYTITYHPSLDTNATFDASGATIASNTTTHDWYGYFTATPVPEPITLLLLGIGLTIAGRRLRLK